MNRSWPFRFSAADKTLILAKLPKFNSSVAFQIAKSISNC